MSEQNIPAATETVQTEQVATNEATKSNDLMSPKFAALARKEKAIRQMMKDYQQKEAALKAKEAEWQKKESEWNNKLQQESSWKERIKNDPYGLAMDAGLSAEEAAAKFLNQPSPQDQSLYQLQKQLQALEENQRKTVEEINNERKTQFEYAKSVEMDAIGHLVNSNPEFETIKALKAENAVYALIEQEYKETGKRLSREEAAKEVEEYLSEQVDGIIKLNKYQKKYLANQSQEKTQEQEQPPTQEKNPITTLTNKMVTTSKPLTNKERRERAIAAFQGKLN